MLRHSLYFWGSLPPKSHYPPHFLRPPASLPAGRNGRRPAIDRPPRPELSRCEKHYCVIAARGCGGEGRGGRGVGWGASSAFALRCTLCRVPSGMRMHACAQTCTRGYPWCVCARVCACVGAVGRAGVRARAYCAWGMVHFVLLCTGWGAVSACNESSLRSVQYVMCLCVIYIMI